MTTALLPATGSNAVTASPSLFTSRTRLTEFSSPDRRQSREGGNVATQCRFVGGVLGTDLRILAAHALDQR